MSDYVPVPFIVNAATEEGEMGQLMLNKDAVDLLQRTGPVAVVSVIGRYRTGKSYLLNRLHGGSEGFPLGDTVQGKTKGIWLWAMPHPSQEDLTLLLLDIEGLNDIEKGDSTHDIKLFCLAVLLSSTLILNTTGALDDTQIQQLHLVTELTEHIKTGSPEKEEDGLKFNLFFPKLIFVLRDFFLKLELDEKPCTPDEYMENALKMRKGKTRKIDIYNKPRDCIRSFFPQRKCFVLPKPTEDHTLLGRLDKIEEDKLKPEFLDELKQLVDYVFTTESKPMTVSGNAMSGARYVHLVQSYVKSLNEGRCPCIDSALSMLIEAECSKAVESAVNCFKEKMEHSLKDLPVSSEHLQKARNEASEEAIRLFDQSALKDSAGVYFEKLMGEIEKTAKIYVDLNNKRSTEKCDDVLQEVFKPLRRNINDGVYLVKNGYAAYRKDNDEAIAAYRGSPGKGVQAEKVLDNYLRSCVTEENTILQADKALSEQQKDLEKEREARHREEQNAKMTREENDRIQKEMLAQQSVYGDRIKTIQQQFEKQRQDIEKDHQRDLQAKEKEFTRLQQEGLKEQAGVTQELIEQLKQEKQIKEEEHKRQLEIIEGLKKKHDEMVNQMVEGRKEDRNVISDLRDQIAQAKEETNIYESTANILGGIFQMVIKGIEAYSSYKQQSSMFDAIRGGASKGPKITEID